MKSTAVLAVAVALLAAPLLPALVNRTKAICGGRRGQPLLQPYFDLARLLRKEAVYSTTTGWLFRTGPVVGLASTLGALLLVPFGGSSAPVAFSGDLLLFAYLLALGRFVTILAALDTGSSFEGMGASREATVGALAEPALLLGLAAVLRQAGWLSLSASVHPFGAAGSVTTLLVLGALTVVFLAENARVPVDDPNTHLELTMIHEVMVLDHSGPDLAFIHYGSALKLWVLGALIVGLVVPQPAGQQAYAFLLALAGMAAVAVATGLIESVLPRLRLVAVPQFLLAGSALATVALVLELR